MSPTVSLSPTGSAARGEGRTASRSPRIARARRGPAPRIPGRGGEPGGRPARAAGRARAGSERRQLGEEPGPAAAAVPGIGLLCCNFARALRGGAPSTRPLRAFAPGKFASLGRAGRGDFAPPLGGPWAVASPKEGDSARAISHRPGPVSAPRPREGGRRGSGRSPASPGPWLPDKGVLEVVAEDQFIIPRKELAKGLRGAEHTFVSLAVKGASLRGAGGPRASA